MRQCHVSLSPPSSWKAAKRKYPWGNNERGVCFALILFSLSFAVCGEELEWNRSWRLCNIVRGAKFRISSINQAAFFRSNGRVVCAALLAFAALSAFYFGREKTIPCIIDLVCWCIPCVKIMSFVSREWSRCFSPLPRPQIKGSMWWGTQWGKKKQRYWSRRHSKHELNCKTCCSPNFGTEFIGVRCYALGFLSLLFLWSFVCVQEASN